MRADGARLERSTARLTPEALQFGGHIALHPLHPREGLLRISAPLVCGSAIPIDAYLCLLRHPQIFTGDDELPARSVTGGDLSRVRGTLVIFLEGRELGVDRLL